MSLGEWVDHTEQIKDQQRVIDLLGALLEIMLDQHGDTDVTLDELLEVLRHPGQVNVTELDHFIRITGQWAKHVNGSTRALRLSMGSGGTLHHILSNLPDRELEVHMSPGYMRNIIYDEVPGDRP